MDVMSDSYVSVRWSSVVAALLWLVAVVLVVWASVFHGSLDNPVTLWALVTAVGAATWTTSAAIRCQVRRNWVMLQHIDRTLRGQEEPPPQPRLRRVDSP